ncbi:MAG: hypothetical protein AB7F19_03330 [Candidatus Babeliales bacterium]
MFGGEYIKIESEVCWKHLKTIIENKVENINEVAIETGNQEGSESENKAP